LQGHERPITVVKFNYDGDLLFSASKDMIPSVWMIDCNATVNASTTTSTTTSSTAAENHSKYCQRLGTYEGHKGTVWDLDIDRHSRRLLTASADSTCKLWRVDTGECLATYKHYGSVRSVSWAIGGMKFATISDPFMEYAARIRVYNIIPLRTPWDLSTDGSTDPALHPDTYSSINTSETVLEVEIPKLAKRVNPVNIYWTHNNKYLLVSFDNGTIRRYDSITGQVVLEKVIHDSHKKINRLRFNRQQTLAITSGADFLSHLCDPETWNVIKTYKTDRPVNDAVISEVQDHILLGGGQEAMSVTTTAGKVGKFETRFFHLVYETEFGTVKGHFGPINALDIAPNGRVYASGAEDGYVRLHFFDTSYLQMKDPVPEDNEPLEDNENEMMIANQND
jgi:translation initiation factor 3 subunit I